MSGEYQGTGRKAREVGGKKGFEGLAGKNCAGS
jgi:hypothetical protein